MRSVGELSKLLVHLFKAIVGLLNRSQEHLEFNIGLFEQVFKLVELNYNMMCKPEVDMRHVLRLYRQLKFKALEAVLWIAVTTKARHTSHTSVRNIQALCAD